MSNTATNIEYLKIKAFLYKLTPTFQKQTSAPKTSTLGKMDRYTVDLNESFFSKYDITDFVTGYSFDQSLDGNTYSWNVTLQDSVITFEDLNKRVLVEGNQIKSSTDLKNIAQYEAQAKDLTDANIIQEAIVERGTSQPAMTVKAVPSQGTAQPLNLLANTNTPEVIEGVRLSDLFQKYDYVSLFLYKNSTPIEELKGGVVTSSSPFKLPVFVTTKNGRTLGPADLQKESILLSSMGTKGTLFSNEFNGYVLRKAFTQRLGGVDSVTISGNGITRLFGATRRVLKPSLMMKSIYDIGELPDPLTALPYQNNYVGKSVEEIFADLFNVVYRIKFATVSKKQLVPTFTRVKTANGWAYVSSGNNIIGKNRFGEGNYFDASSLLVNNANQTNLFTIPPYLLMLVMSKRGFSIRKPKDESNLNTLITGSTKAGVRRDTQGNTFILQNYVEAYIDSNEQNQTKLLYTSPVYYSKELNQLKPYFKLISEVFTFFNPEFKTPFEIINELKEKTFLEFFERPDGTVIIRPPQYNDTTSTIFSSDLEIQNITYNDGAEGLISRQKVGYGVDAIEQVESIKEYSFGNGKLLIQYGFMEAGTDINPNVKNDKIQDSDLTQTKENGLFKYAEFFLRLHNASLKTGSITANLNPNIIVGKTFFDEKNRKFGYITNVSKSVDVAGNATMTFNLSFVRDAYLSDSKQVSAGTAVVSGKTVPVANTLQRNKAKDASYLQFEKLDRLVDISSNFAPAGTVDTTVTDPAPVSVSFISKPGQ